MASSRRTGTNESRWTGSAWEAGVNTFGAGGFGRDYTALQTWEGDTDNDLVTAAVSPALECHKDAASYDLGMTVYGCDIYSAITSAAYFRVLRAAADSRHLGVPGAGVKFIGPSVTYACLDTDESYSQIQDVEVLHENSYSGNACGIGLYDPGNVAVGCIVKSVSSGAGSNIGFIFLSGNDQKAVNCIAYECELYGFELGGNAAQALLNCTTVNCQSTGIRYSGTDPRLVNCASHGNVSYDFYPGNANSGTTHNLSGDATAPATGTYYRSKVLYFMAAQGFTDDYRLAPADKANAQGKGTDLSADASFAFDDDIAFNARGTAWDLGAIQWQAAGSSRRSGVNEQISTFGASGQGRGYTALSTWEVDTDNDLVAARESEVLECYADQVFTLGAGVAIGGSTASAYYRRIVRAASTARHLGIPGAGVVFTTSADWYCVSVDESYAAMQDLEARASYSSASAVQGIRITSGLTSPQIVGVIAVGTNAGANSGAGIASTWADVSPIVVNCIAFGSDDFGIVQRGGQLLYCTAVRSMYGLVGNSADPRFIGGLASSNTTGDFATATGGATGTTHNLSSDATAPALGTYYRNKTLLWGRGSWSHSGLSGFTAAKINDGDLASNAFYGDSAPVGAYLLFDAGAVSTRAFTSVRWTNAGTTTNPRYDIQYSDDGSSWTTVVSQWQANASASCEVSWSNAGAHRYWRFYKSLEWGTPWTVWTYEVQWSPLPAPDTYLLGGEDTDAIDKGIDLSEDPYFPFTDDVAFTVRGAAWDLGAFEYVETGSPVARIRFFLRRWRW